jgi:hypothetical protein
VADQPWFKVWAKASLGSLDLNSLLDHEERIWWRLLCVASEEEERWHVTMAAPALARFCATTPPKLTAALALFTRKGMLTADPGGWWVTNWEKYQETPEAKRKRLYRAGHVRGQTDGHVPDKSADKSRQEVRGKRIEDRSTTTNVAVVGDDDLDPVFGDCFGTMVDAFGGKVNQRMADEYRQIADENTLEEITEAIRSCKRDAKRPYPSELWKRLQKGDPDGTSEQFDPELDRLRKLGIIVE